MPISDLSPLFGFVGTVVGAFGLWLSNRRGHEISAMRAATESEDTDRDNARDDAAALAAQWQSMLDNQRRDFEILLDPMRKQIDDLNTKVGALETVLTRLRGLLRVALDHVRDLRSRWPDGHPMPDLPDALRDEL